MQANGSGYKGSKSKTVSHKFSSLCRNISNFSTVSNGVKTGPVAWKYVTDHHKNFSAHLELPGLITARVSCSRKCSGVCLPTWERPMFWRRGVSLDWMGGGGRCLRVPGRNRTTAGVSTEQTKTQQNVKTIQNPTMAKHNQSEKFFHIQYAV